MPGTRKSSGVSYSGFCKLVERHAADARIPSSSSPRPRAEGGADIRASQASAAKPVKPKRRPGPDRHPRHRWKEPPSHAGQQPTQTFIHDPVERPGDYERLLGIRRR